MSKLAIIIIVEPGLLESQAMLLVDSINKFLKPTIDLDVFTFSPRINKKPDPDTVSYLQAQGVTHFNLDLNIKYDHFPLANGLYASCYFEQHFDGYQHILLTDTDTVFLNPLPQKVFEANTVFVSPADNKGVGSTGEGDKNDPFWQQMFAFFGLALPAPSLNTTVRTECIRPYHNSGFVMVNNIAGFYQQWFEDFDALMESGLKPDFIGRDGTDYGFFEQLVLSITTARHPEKVRYFDSIINYPIPFRPFLQNQQAEIAFDQLTHIHYHKWFQHPGFLDHITSQSEQASSTFKWLQSYLPFKPEIEGSFKC